MANVLFLGGKEIGHHVLNHLVKDDHVVFCFTNPSDEDSNQWYPTVKQVAEKYNLPYITENVNTFFLNYVPAMTIDWIVCAYYDYIIPKYVLDMANYKLNIHFGLIQQDRGAYPTVFPIIEGRKKTGVTIHELTESVDLGGIYAQSSFNLTNKDTGKSVYTKCVALATELFERKWNFIKKAPHLNSCSSKAKLKYRKDFPSQRLNSKWNAEKIDRYARALTFPPFPRPYIILNGNKFELHHE